MFKLNQEYKQKSKLCLCVFVNKDHLFDKP